MNEQIEKISKEGLEKALAWANTAENFAVEQTPLLIQEIIRLGITIQTFWMVLSLIVGATSCIIWKKTLKSGGTWEKIWNESYPDITINQVKVIVSVIFLFISCIVFSVNTFYLLKIIFAPRIYVLQELSKLI